jgi:hypothetical protein
MGGGRDRRAERRGLAPTSAAVPVPNSTVRVRGGRARRPKARRSSGSEIAAEAFMNNAG